MNKEIMIYPHVKLLLSNEKEHLDKLNHMMNIKTTLCPMKEARQKRVLTV